MCVLKLNGQECRSCCVPVFLHCSASLHAFYRIRKHQLHVLIDKGSNGSLHVNACYALCILSMLLLFVLYCINNFVPFSCFMLPPICTSLCQTKLSGRQTLDLLVKSHTPYRHILLLLYFFP